MLELFKKDIFSNSKPIFREINKKDYDKFKFILEEFLPDNLENLKKIEKLYSGLEKNSNNFKVTFFDNTKYALKRLSPLSDLHSLLIRLELIEDLTHKSNSIVRPLRNRKNKFTFHIHGYIWILTEFFDGDYFSGDITEIDSIGKTIVNFHKNLKLSSKSKKIPIFNQFKSLKIVVNNLKRFLSKEEDWHNLFSQEECYLMNVSKEVLKNSIFNIQEYFIDVEEDNIPIHIDLHPHNLLINKKMQSILLDLDSIFLGNYNLALGFCCYKLGRQIIINNKSRKIYPAKLLLDSLNIDFNREVLLNYQNCALYEILRRFSIITELNIKSKDRSWNKIIPVHLAGLSEIPLIFRN